MDPILDYARERLANGSKSFAAAAKLFAPQTRADATMLYAWCRHCDDVIDDQELGFARDASPTRPLDRLAELEHKTRAAMAGSASEAPFVALARVAERNAIPAAYPLDHLAGFRMDVDGREYHTVEDVVAYSYHVAGVVGVMMTMVMGAREADTLRRAADLGIAFQLTNIARDVLDDAVAGRVYLPADLLAAEGVDPAAIGAPEQRERVMRVALVLLDTADGYYRSAGHGLTRLPLRCAWAIATARHVYRDIGRVIRARGPAAWETRAVVGPGRKLYGIARSAARAAGTKAAAPLLRPPTREGLWTHPSLLHG